MEITISENDTSPLKMEDYFSVLGLRKEEIKTSRTFGKEKKLPK